MTTSSQPLDLTNRSCEAVDEISRAKDAKPTYITVGNAS